MDTTRSLKMHPDLLFSVISQQAGSLDKALLEMTINSVDAGATSIEITLTRTGFQGKDDGKGFGSREAIEQFFETFGTPHKEGDATYGKFRMGRGQLFSFGANEWRSGPYCMKVDIKNAGLDYILSEAKSPVQGCVIVGSLYDPLSNAEFEGVCRSLKTLVGYMQIPVILNGTVINKSPSQEKWDIETPDAYIRLRKTGDLQVYNLGAYVKAVPGHEFGLGGVVVSKSNLQVNFARNDILVSKCAVWKRICKALKAESNQQAMGSKEAMSDSQRDRLVRDIQHGLITDSDVLYEHLTKAKILTDVNGAHMTVATFFRKTSHLKVTVCPPAQRHKGETIHSSKIALVLGDETLRRFGDASLQDIIDTLHEKITQYGQFRYTPKSITTDFQPLADSISDIQTTVDDKKLSKSEARFLSAIRKGSSGICWTVGNAVSGARLEERQILAGSCETADAWTDGKTYNALNRKFLKGVVNLDKCLRVVHILVHEYLHDQDDTGSHEHGQEFYERFHDITIDSGERLFSHAAHIFRLYLKASHKAGAPINRSTLYTLDSLEQHVEEQSDPSKGAQQEQQGI